MSTTNDVTVEDLHALLGEFARRAYTAGSCEEKKTPEANGEPNIEAEVLRKCEYLFKKDYTIVELDNKDGILSPHYPARIFIPEHEHGHMASTLPSTSNASLQNSNTNDLQNNTCSSGPSVTDNAGIHAFVTFANAEMQQKQYRQQMPNPLANQLQYPHHLMQQTSPSNTNTTTLRNTTNNTIYEDSYDVGKIKDLLTNAKYARCRQRFAVPVIMYRGKFVCRSATVSITAETVARQLVDYAYSYIAGTNYSNETILHNVDDQNNDEDALLSQPSSLFSCEEAINSDIQLLKALNVETIVDLMVENKKIKYNLFTCSSSEKAEPDSYANFNILSLPYPGCEFFKKFRYNSYCAEGLHYDWNEYFNDANISAHKLNFINDLKINWHEYKNWDLVLLTQNYMKACLNYIKEEKKGLLIHCISGWDRTPLFISLVRLSLWADGLIHQSLDVLQIVYLTVAYDWYLFGHQLPSRLSKEEDILPFCFNVLKHMLGDEFSIVEERRRSTKTSFSSAANKNDSGEEDVVFLGCEADNNDGISLNSFCDVSLTDTYYVKTPPTSPPKTSDGSNPSNNPITNRSPNLKRTKTNPISVPGGRQRNESTSSTESWACVNAAGSIESTINGSFLRKEQHNINCGCYLCNESDGESSDRHSNSSKKPQNSSNNSATSLDDLLKNKTIRHQRLNTARILFGSAYAKVVGLKLNEGSGMSIPAMLMSLAAQIAEQLRY